MCQLVARYILSIVSPMNWDIFPGTEGFGGIGGIWLLCSRK